MDPLERMIDEGGGYFRWWGEKLWTIMPASAIVGQFLETFKEYPPSQTSATIKVEEVLKALQAGSAGGGN
jgi:arylsulfatase